LFTAGYVLTFAARPHRPARTPIAQFGRRLRGTADHRQGL
jgi:hypothetical protein